MTDIFPPPFSVVVQEIDALENTETQHGHLMALMRHRAMLAAAPKPPVVEQPQGEQEPVAWMHQCRKKPELVKLSFKKREPALAASGYKARPLIFGDTAKPRQPLTDEQQIAEAMRRHGLVLVKTVNGYDVLKLGQITAHGIGGEA